MKYYYSNRNKKRLIIFFAGWASNKEYFAHLTDNNYDELLFYNYSNDIPDIDLDTVISKYDEIVIIAWSFGVLMANNIMWLYRQKISKAIAINGTLKPIDDNMGIPVRIFNATLNNITAQGMQKFYSRMCIDEHIIQRFNLVKNYRNIADLCNELTYLKTYSNCAVTTQNIFNFALISVTDKIIPTKNQYYFWQQNQIPVKTLSGGHFPFFYFDNWKSLIAFCTNN